jgi:hypothetical protein
MIIERFVEGLKSVKKTPNGYSARCPAHDDKNASLCVGTGDDGRILAKCQAGCSLSDITAAMGIKVADLFNGERNGHASKPEITETYDYTDESGKLLFQVCRFVPKDFRQRAPDGKGGWNWSLKDVRRVLHRLPKVLDAVKRGLPVLIVEGEKDVHACEKHGFVATCNPGGAGKWLDEYSETLHGADVVIIGDNDDAGRKHAELVGLKLKGIAKSIRPVTLPIGKDAFDFFSGGGTTEQLIELIDKAKPAKSFAEIVEERRFNPTLQPPTIRPVFSCGGIVTSTPGNLTSINAQVKVGKTAVVNAQIASTMPVAGADTLGFTSENPNGFAVIHFDTEQSIEDHWHGVDRMLRRAGRTIIPPWFWTYCLTGFEAIKALKAVTMTVERAAQQFKGIHSIHIDGVADLVRDVNDPEECNAFVANLHALAIDYDCPIICVLHFNPNSEKTRGHLGSQLERKSETNLRLDKDGEVTELWSEKQRRAPILKGRGPRFKWSDEAGMHVSVESGRSEKDAERIEHLVNIRDDIFSGRPSMRYAELESEVQKVTKKSEATAKRILREWVHFQLVTKSVGGLWTPTN